MTCINASNENSTLCIELDSLVHVAMEQRDGHGAIRGAALPLAVRAGGWFGRGSSSRRVSLRARRTPPQISAARLADPNRSAAGEAAGTPPSPRGCQTPQGLERGAAGGRSAAGRAQHPPHSSTCTGHALLMLLLLLLQWLTRSRAVRTWVVDGKIFALVACLF